MCIQCWIEFGRPAIKNDRVLAAVAAIKTVYAESETGGAMHVVTDDWNLGESLIKDCRDCAETDAERACADALLALTEEERASALAFTEGFVV